MAEDNYTNENDFETKIDGKPAIRVGSRALKEHAMEVHVLAQQMLASVPPGPARQQLENFSGKIGEAVKLLSDACNALGPLGNPMHRTFKLD